MKKEILVMLIGTIIISLIVSYMPYLGFSDPIYYTGISIIFQLVVLLFLGNSLAKSGLLSNENQKLNLKNFTILSPITLFYGAIAFFGIAFKSDLFGPISKANILIIVSYILTAIIDGLFFGTYLRYRLRYKSRLKRIFLIGGIFALFELISNIQYLYYFPAFFVRIAATFILGSFFAFITEFMHSIYPTIIFEFIHLLFYEPFYFFLVLKYPIIILFVLGFLALYVVLSYLFYFRRSLD